MISVLVLGSGSQGLATVSSLKRCGFRIVILFDDKNNYADRSRCVDKKYYVSSSNKEVLLTTIERIVKDEKIKAILPMGDADAIFLSKNKDRLEKLLKLGIPSTNNFNKGYDKNQLMNLCREKGYPHPQTIDMSNIILTDDSLKTFPYPALLKPNCTTGGRGMHIVNGYEELLGIYEDLHAQYGEYHLQRFIEAGGRQVKIQLLVDGEGNLVNSSVLQKVRWYPVKGGSSSCSVSIEDDERVKMCHCILKDIGWEGFADFDLIENPAKKELLVMEINPRLPACIKGAISAGVNWPEIIVNYVTRGKQKEYTYVTGRILRHLGFEVLWFMKSSNRIKAQPSWFKFFGKEVSYQDMNGWTDPMPFIYGTINNIKKIFLHKK